MAIDTRTLTQIITDFRAIQTSNSISPETVGYIFQRIADLLASAGTSETVELLQKLIDAFAKAGSAIISISQGQADRNHIYMNIGSVELGNGVTHSTSGIFIQQATTERAGAMRAQQVTDLNAARNNVAAIQKQLVTIEETLSTLQSLVGNGNSSSVIELVNSAHIDIQIINGKLHLFGASKLLKAGYVPYLFRWTRKRNHYHVKNRTEKDMYKRYCGIKKGWNLYGSCHTVSIDKFDTVVFSTNPKTYLSRVAMGYSSEPTVLVSEHTTQNGEKTIGWGRSTIRMRSPFSTKNRMIRLPLAIGFAKKILPNKVPITQANLVSPLIKFSLVYNPTSNAWSFSK